MRIFVTGASGWIGSAVVPELQRAGHTVVGLARSDASAAAVADLGAEVHRGDLSDLDSLRAAASAADGVVHLGYVHDFSQIAAAAQTDANAIRAFGETGRPLVVAGGTLGLVPAGGSAATETDRPDPASHPRNANALAALALAEHGVRASLIRFAPTVHGQGDHGFIATLVTIARDRGVSAYIDDGTNRWPAVHRFDAADLVRRAIDAAAGQPDATDRERAGRAEVLHATAEDGVPARAIAEAIGRGLGLPVVSVPADRAGDHFGWLGPFFGADIPASSALTRAKYGWTPSGPGLIEDLDAGHYFQG